MGTITAVCTSKNKGEKKNNVEKGKLIIAQGLEEDAHAGFEHRQVSLLATESIQKMPDKGVDLKPGDFGENLLTQGIDLLSLPVGALLQAGPEAVLRVSQIGKECHHRCAIYEQVGDCIMPREGIFAEVIKGGEVAVGHELIRKPSYKFGIITASSKGAVGEREDSSGPKIAEMLRPYGEMAEHIILPDDREALSSSMKQLADSGIDAIFSSGGTGLSPQDVTPEATLDVIDRQVPGIAEAIRRETASSTPRAMLSRGVAGIRGRTLIVNLPGSRKAVEECLEVILPILEHALETLTGRGADCAR